MPWNKLLLRPGFYQWLTTRYHVCVQFATLVPRSGQINHIFWWRPRGYFAQGSATSRTQSHLSYALGFKELPGFEALKSKVIIQILLYQLLLIYINSTYRHDSLVEYIYSAVHAATRNRQSCSVHREYNYSFIGPLLMPFSRWWPTALAIRQHRSKHWCPPFLYYEMSVLSLPCHIFFAYDEFHLRFVRVHFRPESFDELGHAPSVSSRKGHMKPMGRWCTSLWDCATWRRTSVSLMGCSTACYRPSKASPFVDQIRVLSCQKGYATKPVPKDTWTMEMWRFIGEVGHLLESSSSLNFLNFF